MTSNTGLPGQDPRPAKQQFASDNYAGVCPEVMTATERANDTGHELAYGDDRWTGIVCDRMRELFETDCEVFFVFNGTAANALSLASLCQSYHAVICHDHAHVELDECGAPEFFSNGSKLLLVEGRNGKLTPEALEAQVTARTDIHFPKPKAVSLTQATEFGTVYAAEEVGALSEIAKRHGLKVHMDGARFSNAVAALDVRPSEISWRAGVDVLCFGGTKNGLATGEAVVFFDKDLAEDFAYRVKQAGQLCSKMRFISAPWLGLLDNDIWLKNARHANAMAKRLLERMEPLADVEILFPAEANAVFARIPEDAKKAMWSKGWRFYDFIGSGGCRFMCAWDTSPEAVDQFAADLVECCAVPAGDLRRK